MLLLWLRQRYNVERYGPPTWQTLVKAVEHEIPALAKTISAKHLHPGNCMFFVAACECRSYAIGILNCVYRT